MNDEFIVPCLVVGFGLLRLYGPLLRQRAVGGISPAILGGAVALPPLFLAVLFVGLCAHASIEVRQGGYLLPFIVLGAAWLVAAVRAVGLLGIHVVDDALERNNTAAAIAGAGASLGAGAAYTFANFGEGPTVWTTIGPALLATFACWLLWLGHQLATDAADAISIGRDLASGIRFGGLALATGLIVGRAVAGDWESASGTWRDFTQQAWPALPLVLAAIAIQRRLQPTAARPQPSLRFGVLPALFYLAFSALDLLVLGSWKTQGGAP